MDHAEPGKRFPVGVGRAGLAMMVLAGLVFVAPGCSPGHSPPAGAIGADEPLKEDARMIRKVQGSNRWFPGDGRQLAEMVNGYIDQAAVPKIEGRIVAVISPHAGYVYSGAVAGHSFRAVKDNAAAGHKPDCVVVVGFSHSTSFPGLALMDGDGIRTPLGVAALDVETGESLTRLSRRIAFNYPLHGTEHSAENQIPFVQAALPDVKMVVGLIGDHDLDTIGELVRALSEVGKKKKLLVVASTDLLHHADYERVKRTDKSTLERIVAMDEKGLLDAYSREQVCCGVMAVLTAMKFAGTQGCEKGTLLYSRNSGDDHPESRGNYVVGYGAVAFAAP